jgi:3'-phosphoadenosine 5'-phosphosulfate sulfotransferase (PAPS reductase)/FAD synthetase
MTDYTLYHFGISGGKDSTALLLWAVHESGYPHDQMVATFCDTGNEHQITYDYIQMLNESVFPIQTIKPPLDFYQLAEKKKRFPSSQARFCTQSLKMQPSQEYIKSLMQSGERVLLHSGVRADESENRKNLPEREWDEYYACDVFRPLINWSIEDVYATLAKYGIPRNPLYDYGAKRVGCFPCIMSRKYEIRMIAKNFPERIDRIRESEKMGDGYHSFFARNMVPLKHRTKMITTESGEQMLVASIDDVVRWSKTGRYRPNQYEMDFDEPIVCNSTLGHCE